jgi:hypothetical protein
MTKFSIVIPVHNEEDCLPACLASIATAAERVADEVETIIVLNRCTDRTEEIAQEAGAVLAYEDAKNLARIRNAGAAVARGEILCTIDADSRMAPNALETVEAALATGKYVGGGVGIKPERWSLGIALTGLVIWVYVQLKRATGGMFWCCRKDFEAIGGFNEDFVTVEDLDFAIRLRQHGKATGRRITTLWRAPITTSCRKFDRFGDWYLLRHPIVFWRLLGGKNRRHADAFYYDFKRNP